MVLGDLEFEESSISIIMFLCANFLLLGARFGVVLELNSFGPHSPFLGPRLLCQIGGPSFCAAPRPYLQTPNEESAYCIF